MKLKELNAEVEYINDFQLIEQIQHDFLLLLERELKGEILEEGLFGSVVDKVKNTVAGAVDKVVDTIDTGKFIVKIWNNNDELALVSNLLHKTTWKTINKPFYDRLNDFIAKMDKILTTFAQNKIIVTSVTVIKNLVGQLITVVSGTYSSVQALKGHLKLLAAIGFSFIAKLLADKVEVVMKVFDVLDIMNSDKLVEFFKETKIFDGFISDSKSMWKSVSDGIVDVIGVATSVLNDMGVKDLLVKIAGSMNIIFASVKDAVAYILSVMEVAKRKWQATLDPGNAPTPA